MNEMSLKYQKLSKCIAIKSFDRLLCLIKKLIIIFFNINTIRKILIQT